VLVTLEESSDYEILGANGTEAMADQAAGGQRSACVPTQDKETVVVRIRPLVAGSVFINVTAVVDTEFAEPCSSGEVLNKIDRISKPIAVDYEGFPRENTWTSFICDTDSNGTTWNLDAPANIVNNSIRAWINVAGDLLAPTLDNLGHLIRMPYGCGEQNMVTFTPNIYVLQYLQASNQANEIVTERLLTYMRNGYQRELTFKRSDGSYGCFGETDESGSTWLTAFVVKSYAQSLNFIDVDLNEILMSSNFLKSVQLESGCFASVGTVHNKRMKGGVGASDTPGTLTAYVMAALLEAGVDATVPAITSATACINAATAPGTEGENDIYLLALKAYAYSLAGLPQTEDTINDLLDRSTQVPEAIYWDMNSLNGLYSSALSVETASYVLLAMLTANIPDSQQTTLNIVKGISYWFNGLGSFVSTQDTVVALQALALYASHQDQPLNLDVTAVGDNLNVVFQITESNKLVIQRADVDVISNNVTVDATGSGCALVQAVVRFNVPDPNLSEVFLLSVETFVDYNNPVCRANRIRICGTYLLNDGESNMGIIEVNLVSGYAPQIEDLQRIVSDVTGSIMRYEVEDGKVLFYINQFTDSETCIEFTATEVTEVEDVRPGTVKIYDYYEPEFFMSETYTFTRRVCRT
ncbi:Alpha-macroglobulin complement component, partial [Trinorchestia longiramus]